MSEVDSDIYEHVKAIAKRLSCGRDGWEDLAHDAIVKIMDNENQFDKLVPGTFKAWASIVAANCIIDQLRREGKRADVEAQWTDQYAKDSDRLNQWLAVDRTSPLPVNSKDAA